MDLPPTLPSNVSWAGRELGVGEESVVSGDVGVSIPGVSGRGKGGR